MDGGPFVTLPQVYTEDPDRPGPGDVEPGHVPRAARGQRVRAESRGRAALPDPPRDRRAPRRGDPPRRAAAGQRLRRRPAGADRRRRDAAARGAARAGLRRGAGGPARRDGRARTGGLPMPAEADFVISGTIDPHAAQARGAVRRPPRLLQPRARLSRCSGSSASITAQGAIWPFTSVGRPPQEDTTLRRLDPRADRPDHPDA